MLHNVYLSTHLKSCIYDFYIKGAVLHYKSVVDLKWYTDANHTGNILSGYIFDDVTMLCYLEPTKSILGISQSSFNFLMALSAILIGFIFIFGLVNSLKGR